MKISAINSTNKLHLNSSVKQASSDFSGKFKEILDSIKGEMPNALKDKLSSGWSFQAPELLLYQIQLGRTQLRVELLSRVGDAFLSFARRIQQGG